MDHQFCFDIRVLMCSNCGAPLQTAFAGGTVTCGYCGTINVFTPRREEPVEPMAAAMEIDEEQRMALLQRQDGIQPEVPAGIRQLLSGGVLAPWKEGEALAMWKTTCGELGAGSDFSSAELLYFLTIILSNHFSGKDANFKQRALYESALEVLTLPRHRQLIRGLLSRHATLEGEIEAAEKWLEPCNPRSEDLESDSSYRVSKAEILTVREDWNGVLDVLGRKIDEIPITAALDGKAIVQRANALERAGQTKTAAEQLSLFITANGSQGRNALEMITGVYENAGIQICSESMKIARDMSSRKVGVSLAGVENPGGFFGQVFAVTGALLLVLSFVLYRTIGSLSEGASIAPGVFVGTIGVVFLAIGIRHIRAGTRTRRIHADGIEARAVLKAITATGWKISNAQQYALEIEVKLSGKEPYTVTVKKIIPDGMKEMFHIGAEVNVRVDPKDRNHVIVED